MGKIVLITGAPGAGKSTVARRLAEQLPQSLHLQVDRLREMMVNGIALPSGGWTNKAARQMQWARAAACYMARFYADQEVTVFIDDVALPATIAEDYAALQGYPEMYWVLLMPSIIAVANRMQKREGAWDATLIELLPWLYSFSVEPMPKTGWLVFDTSDWSVEQTMQAVLRGMDA